MYRVMLVDDEPLILAGIASMLEWEQYDCRIVGKATNGQQALEKMEELQPDVVITDIKMPAMDGLELIRQSQKKGFLAQFILLTNLEDFALAREAMRLGAMEYLVKLEISEEMLAEVLGRVISRCEKLRPKQEETSAVSLSVEDTIRTYFRRVLVYDMDGKADENLERLIRERFLEPVLVLIHFNYGAEGFSSDFTREDQKKTMGFAEDIINEMVRGFFDQSSLIRRDQNGFILVVSAACVEDYKESIRKMGEKFVSIIKDYFGVPATVTVSQKGETIEEFPELLYQVMSAMNYTYYDSSEPIVFYSEKCETSSRHSSNFNISFLKKDLGQSIRQRDAVRFGEIMDQVISLLKEHQPTRPQAINGCSSLYYFVMSFFEEQGEGDFPYAVDIIGQLNRMSTLYDIIQWTCGFKEKVSAVLTQKQAVKVDRHVELACQYVKEHYREKIFLGQVAELLGVSQGYLSSTFKKQMGQAFTDYVNTVKVEQAKVLITAHKYMMYEISDMLGFDTQYYFSTVFKKVAGCTPKEYENQTLHEKIVNSEKN